MKNYKFEIKSLIEVFVEANNVEEARINVIDELNDGGYDDVLSDAAHISDGENING